MQPPPTSDRQAPVVTLDLQLAHSQVDPCELPSEDDFRNWVNAVLSLHHIEQAELTIRTVDSAESQTLNLTYRGQDKPTNVLSFPFDSDIPLPVLLLGDLVICVPVMQAEAAAQNKALDHHWAHLVIHGTLHLLGYDHIVEDEAERMERLETQILNQFNIADPYQQEPT